MPKITVIYWRDIPAQVIVQKGSTRLKKELPQRFAQAIDRAAMRAGRGSSADYLEDWRRESRKAEGDPEALGVMTLASLEARFPDEALERAVERGGIIEAED